MGEILNKETGGGVGLRVLTSTEYGKGSPVSPSMIVANLLGGKLEMTQTYTPLLGQFDMDLWALDLPFLFRDHAHAAAVLDGPIGQRLLKGLLHFNLRGLAFTYSGGFRMIATKDREIHRWEDLNGLKMRTSYSPVSIRLMEQLGVTPVPSRTEDVQDLADSGEIDAAESTYPRYWALGHNKSLKTINETYHSLFLTAIVVNERFFKSLPKAYQASLEGAAKQAAVMERAQSISDGETARKSAQEMGLKIVTMSEPERRRFAERTESMYERFAPMFGRDLLDAVRKSA